MTPKTKERSWERPSLAEHQHLEQKRPGWTTCACGQWGTETQMPLLLGEWREHLGDAGMPRRTNYGLVVLAWNWLGMVACWLLTLYLAVEQFISALHNEWAPAAYSLLLCIVAWFTFTTFRDDYRAARDDT